MYSFTNEFYNVMNKYKNVNRGSINICWKTILSEKHSSLQLKSETVKLFIELNTDFTNYQGKQHKLNGRTFDH